MNRYVGNHADKLNLRGGAQARGGSNRFDIEHILKQEKSFGFVFPSQF